MLSLFFSLMESYNIHRATESGDIAVIRSLLRSGEVQVDAVDQYDRTPLFIACASGFQEIADLLLNEGANINLVRNGSFSRDELMEDYTALHIAAQTGHVGIVKLLLRRGADVHLRANDMTPLHLSCLEGHWQAAAKLLNNVADMSTAPYDAIYGGLVLYCASHSDCKETVKLILSRNANINDVDELGQSALHICLRGRHFGVAELLLRNGASASTVDLCGYTPLHIAAFYGAGETVKLLVHCDGDVNSTARNGKTPLLCACQGKYPDCAEILLKSGACVNIAIDASVVYGTRFTPLHFAANRPHETVNVQTQVYLIELLFEWGADVNAKAQNGKTPFLVFLNWSPGHSYEQAIAGVFVKHLVKMQARNLFVSETNLQAIANHNISSSLSQSCEDEIRRMRQIMIGDDYITLFDVFTKGIPTVADYMEDDNVAIIPESADFMGAFPVYAIEMRKKFHQGRERRDLQRQSDSVLRLGVFRNVPQLCIRRLNRYLRNEDLLKILQARPNPN